jgi:hypothetical protein
VFAIEAALILRVPVKTLYNWCSLTRKTGVLHGPPFSKIGKRLQFRVGDLRQYIRDHTYG